MATSTVSPPFSQLGSLTAEKGRIDFLGRLMLVYYSCGWNIITIGGTWKGRSIIFLMNYLLAEVAQLVHQFA